MLNKCSEEADKKVMFADCAVSSRQQTNKQTSAVSECLYYGGCINDPDHPECLQDCPFQWRSVLPKACPELSKYRDYIVNIVKAKINISK